MIISNHYWIHFADIWCDSSNEQPINMMFQYHISYTRKLIKREAWHKKVISITSLLNLARKIPNYFRCRNMDGNVIYQMKYVPSPVKLHTNRHCCVWDNSLGTNYLPLYAFRYLKQSPCTKSTPFSSAKALNDLKPKHLGLKGIYPWTSSW